MLFTPSRLALQITVLAADGLHAGVGYWLMSSSGQPSGAANGGVRSASMVLVPPLPAVDKPTTPRSPALALGVEPPPALAARESTPADHPARAVPSRTVATNPPVEPARVPDAPPLRIAGPGSPDQPAAGDPDQFMAAALPGEPVIPLEDDDATIAGSLSLRLTIDETGRVVRSDVVARQGLTDKAVAVFVKAFSGYDYIPARRGGRPVRSEVTMVVGVQENGNEPKPP